MPTSDENKSIPDSITAAGGNLWEIRRKQVIETAIQLGVLVLLLMWCFEIIKPFVLIMAWAAIVAIALYPAFEKLRRWLAGSSKLAATLLSMLLVTVLVLPAIILADSFLAGAQALSELGESGALKLPSPPESVKEWPLVGSQIYDFWLNLATNPASVVGKFTPQLQAIGGWLLQTVTGTGLGMLQFIVAFIITGILLANADKGARAAQAFASRLAPNRGPEFAALSSLTIRNVALGIVGVSILQTVLLSAGFIVIDLPAAGLLAMLVLILCIIQVGPGLVAIPAIIYVFYTADTFPAVAFTVWTVLMTFIDSVLKPVIFSRGAMVPTLVIFIGAIGGMIAFGMIGLFVGAVVLSLGYELYSAWLEESPGADTVTPMRE